MILERLVYANLLEWKASTNRKPLLVRGARQVGKTTVVRNFAKEFNAFIELNLERETDKNLFKLNDAEKVLQAACLQKGVIYSEKKSTLLFIDEIQESPEAVGLLRFFYEDLPGVYVIAAGSLLEFALHKVPDFPVGRVEYLFMHPLNFEEFLAAKNNLAALELYNSVPMPDYGHQVLLNLFHEYLIIGGMPEIVSAYVETNNLSALPKIYSRLWQAYKDDIDKYTNTDTERRIIRHVFDTVPFAADRIKFEGFGNSNYRSREVGEALQTLEMARLLQLIYPTTQMQPPIMPDLRKRPRIQLLDTGLLNNLLTIQGEMLHITDFNDYHRGRIIQHVINQEFMSLYTSVYYKPNFWVREEGASNSEIDLVFRFRNNIIPIEIKSGKDGKLRSLHQFIERSGQHFAVRLYAGNISVEQTKTPTGVPYTLINLPYYLTAKIEKYLECFIS
ncbi:MAG TPA: AAA family ATPase [Bacteroidales bacterium]|nr:AAA family ATPase [Bacteroidales bacterium]